MAQFRPQFGYQDPPPPRVAPPFREDFTAPPSVAPPAPPMMGAPFKEGPPAPPSIAPPAPPMMGTPFKEGPRPSSPSPDNEELLAYVRQLKTQGMSNQQIAQAVADRYFGGDIARGRGAVIDAVGTLVNPPAAPPSAAPPVAPPPQFMPPPGREDPPFVPPSAAPPVAPPPQFMPPPGREDPPAAPPSAAPPVAPPPQFMPPPGREDPPFVPPSAAPPVAPPPQFMPPPGREDPPFVPPSAAPPIAPPPQFMPPPGREDPPFVPPSAAPPSMGPTADGGIGAPRPLGLIESDAGIYDGPYGNMLRDEGRHMLSETYGGQGTLYNSFINADPTLSRVNPLMRGALNRLSFPTRAGYFLGALNNPNIGNFRDYLGNTGLQSLGGLDFGNFLKDWRGGNLSEPVTEDLRFDDDMTRQLLMQINQQQVATPFRDSARNLAGRKMAAGRDEMPGQSPYEFVENRGGWRLW